LDARVALPRRPGPLWELAVLFNGMLDRIESLMAGLRESLDHLAHDLRTPLTRVCVRVERALQHESEPERLRETLSDCLEDVREVLAMLDALLDLAEAESGSLRLEREAVPLDEVLARVLELYEFVAEDRHVTLHTELEPGLRVCADRARLRQILANLVDNAIKYSRPEGGEVRIRARRDGERVVIEVRDRGLGIRAEDLPRIWERLYRADRSRSERGLGLGLSLVRALVTALGGDVEVESEVGRGTTFRLRLPAA
ncbi:MAG: two-component sensor histidine kinase, partial [Planctomycetota bacterium]